MNSIKNYISPTKKKTLSYVAKKVIIGKWQI